MTTVALLGTGIMGSGMARNIGRAGLSLRVWNRSREKAEPLSDVATVTGTAAEAVDGADVVVTMLFDENAVDAVMKDVNLGPDAVWVQSSTVGVDATARLARLSDRFVDAPVLGTRQPAENGQLLVLASGPAALKSRVQPIFDAIGQRTVWVSDEPGDASKLKLVLNSWVLSVVAGTGQAIAFAEGLGIDPALFFDSIAGGATDSPYAQVKGKAMLKGDFTPAFGLDGAVKDAGLITEAMRQAGTDPAVVRAIHSVLTQAADRGHEKSDMSAIYHGFR
ncbi:NAD(P)-dependent oxidoreductase [Kibdelosporangium persicum]|uniref:3-hydroxyisobutyrate dehydrogenase n=1 Tax=Kibdelosporangium persicum TaxID=2698649 RepID=A0ABX2F8Y9_9PSEU|nr:NAD(P)-dependent oxidoreductase [Kibdelosporangium persicum]NRN67782.1 3-hydroxyisobutyrate dehydrogenase [Kibdelosporangium persicum]